MEIDLISHLINLRIAVGYLGEKDHFSWWKSSFYTQGSDAFLNPLFPRTKVVAQCHGVTKAAALVHDERIGVGKVFHLFRLPEDMEQAIHTKLHELKTINLVESDDKAISYLKDHSTIPMQNSVGPTRVGTKNSLQDFESWRLVVGLYELAFKTEVEIFPYYSDIS